MAASAQMTGSRHLWAALAAFSVVAAVLPATASATYPGANGRIAFTGSLPGRPGHHIYSVLPSGHGLVQLTHEDADDFNPSWSPDGTQIAFERETPLGGGDEQTELFVMNADGTDQTKITFDGRSYGSPSFAPNGRRVIYGQRVLRHGALVSVRRDGTDPRVIVRGQVGDPVYSPDGHWIAFVGLPEGATGRGGLWLIHPNRSGLRRLTAPDLDHFDIRPDWSPDGSRIHFQRCDFSQYGCLPAPYLIRTDGAGLHSAAEASEVFAPSGGRFAGVTREGDGFGVYCEDVATVTTAGSAFNLTANCADYDSGGQGGFAFDPNWQPLP